MKRVTSKPFKGSLYSPIFGKHLRHGKVCLSYYSDPLFPKNAFKICLEKNHISGILKLFICCILESHKKSLHNFELHLNYCLETYSATPAAMNIKQHLLMSGFSSDRSRLLWFHLVQVYLDWVKQGGVGSLLGPPTLQPPPATG